MRSKEVLTDISARQVKERAKSNAKHPEAITPVESAEQIAGDGEREMALRDKRAQNLAAMGLVTRDGSRYYVKTAAFRGRQENFEVWRDDNGRVRCSCAEFTEMSTESPTFRCEHILAVKYSVAPKAPEKEPEEEESYRTETYPVESYTPESYPPEIDTPETYPPEIYTEENDMNGMEKESAQSAQMESEPKQPTQVAQFAPSSFANLLRALHKPVDPRLIKTREGWTDRQGNTHWVEYIEWHTVADILDRIAPDWSHAVRNITQVGEMVAVTAAITINGVTREGIGTGSAENETGIKKAEHDALKRAAVKFGIARDLYRRESDAIEDDGIAPAIARDPRPKTLGDLVTPKQLWMIRNLGRETHCDVEQECQSLMQCKLEEISKRAASSFIDYLKRRQQEAQPEELQRAG